MNVLFVAAEVAPFVKTGGLADVAGALPGALRAAGHDVRVIMPRYRALLQTGVPMAGPIAASFLPLGERAEEMRLWTGTNGDVPVYFVDIPAAFDRSAIYGEPDDPVRFLLFARGVLDAMQHLREVTGWYPQVVHAHDWHAALVLNYLRTTHAYTFGHIGTVFTIHNLAYQGQTAPEHLALAGLAAHGLIEDRMGPGIAGSFNCMARGIVSADVITTVSPTYAQEILTPVAGERLEGVLQSRAERVQGILNGIDTGRYDPAHDEHLAAAFDADHLDGKRVCKAALQQRAGLTVDPQRPLLGVVSRLVEQKGIDLLDQLLPWLLRETAAQVVVLGTGDPLLEEALRRHADAHPGHMSVTVGFDEGYARQIYAGSDGFLMPSRFEPCGLGQLLALRYGSIPVVRATGGLVDTVREGWDGNGFCFHGFSVREFAEAITRLLQLYDDPASWAIVRGRGMREDHSWHTAAQQYSAAYEWAHHLRIT